MQCLEIETMKERETNPALPGLMDFKYYLVKFWSKNLHIPMKTTQMLKDSE